MGGSTPTANSTRKRLKGMMRMAVAAYSKGGRKVATVPGDFKHKKDAASAVLKRLGWMPVRVEAAKEGGFYAYHKSA